MYIAGRWLMGLAFLMWVAMCSFDEVLKRSKEIDDGFNFRPVVFKNSTILNKKQPKVHVQRIQSDKMPVAFGLNYMMFFAGALVVSLFNKKNEIILFTKSKILQVNFYAISRRLEFFLNKTAHKVRVAILMCTFLFREKSNEFRKMLKKTSLDILHSRRVDTLERLNLLLLTKLKELIEERKNLAQLLRVAIHENKHIRMQHQLESMSKNRLVCHIENTQKQIKESRSRYVSFHQLYLVTQTENVFLKSRIMKVTKEKDEAEKNLINIMNEVFKSKNQELQAYCSRFLVLTKDSIMRSNVTEEIQKFLQKSRKPEQVPSTSSYSICEQCDAGVNTDNSMTRYNDTMITDMLPDENNLSSLVSYAPKLKGLPGEIVWTVKDKNGLIEKLYEYDCESDFDNGDTIRRIREYSVYYDKDCLLDYRKSRTLIQEVTNNSRFYRNRLNELPPTRQNFLTGSQAFQNFLQSNNNIHDTSRSRPTPLLCG